MNVEGGFQVGDLAGVARRRGKIAAFVALLVVLAAYWIAMALPNVYTSYATVLVEPQSVDAELVRAGVQSSNLTERLHIMTAQILARPRLSAIIDKVGLYKNESQYMLREEIIDLMRSRVRVAPVTPELERQGSGRGDADPNEFQIIFEDFNPTIAREVAQRLANDFIESHINSRVALSQKSLEFIQGELQRLAEQIADIEGQIKKVKNENPGKLPEDLDANQRRLERVLSDNALAQRELAEATSDEAFYRTQAAQVAAFSAPNDEASPVRRLELLKLTLADLRSRGFTEKHPDVIKTKAEIDEVDAAVKNLQSSDAEGAGTSLLAQQTQANLQRATLRRAAAAVEIERLQDLVDEIQLLITSTPAVAEQLDALNREYEHLFKSFQDFSQRQLEASVQAQLERRQLGEQFRVIEQAFEAPEPSSPNRLLIIVLGAVFGIGLGAGLALLLEMLDTSPHDARVLQAQLDLPVLASIPQIWLEGDRAMLRRKRLREALATTGLVVFALVGGMANYLWVNGMQQSSDAAPPAGSPASPIAPGVLDAPIAPGAKAPSVPSAPAAPIAERG